MNLVLSIATLVIQILLVIREIRIWKMRVLLSPAFYFGLIWALGALGISIISPIGLLFEKYPENLDELNILVSFTALCFMYWSNKKRTEVIEDSIELNFMTYGTYKVLSIILLAGAVYDFVSLGANLNMGAARENLSAIQDARSVIVGYIQTLAIPLSIYAGYNLLNAVRQYKYVSKGYVVWLLIPLFANLIFSVNIGGRVDVVFCFAEYLLGGSFAMPLNQKIKNNIKPIILTVALSMVVMLFITGVANQRDQFSNGQKAEVEQYFSERSPVLGAIYGPISYIVASYNGYQLRRVDAVDPTHLGYGQYTFNGFINWTLPFSGQIGLGDLSIAKLFGIYYNNQETYDGVRELYYTTHSCYIPIIKDFGFWGALVCIFFLTMIAHNLFIKIQQRDCYYYVTSLFFFFIFWNYWNHSNFYGTLSSSILVPMYGFLIVDIIKLANKHS